MAKLYPDAKYPAVETSRGEALLTAQTLSVVPPTAS
jgi:hypothetical protein